MISVTISLFLLHIIYQSVASVYILCSGGQSAQAIWIFRLVSPNSDLASLKSGSHQENPLCNCGIIPDRFQNQTVSLSLAGSPLDRYYYSLSSQTLHWPSPSIQRVIRERLYSAQTAFRRCLNLSVLFGDLRTNRPKQECRRPPVCM
ncbi:uncharacterized protein P174DRAFT_159939 [Aspergillus novofumigatus IBT 16806]|uniref:Secreted protein n=1 Tax=Aspergillus novofumigatus (strain IBT 16806) TaxID=1392255 RepID=A0A2I1C7X9_ASPN1|nr:uncharacterized protein P174DRAFT_159939 [Aspergillus novofumigatus IBT 16806]PKX93733.1 hypothetical protein P174DRAFT_159939 [Aspergillus novofumigatus IBT 16806]